MKVEWQCLDCNKCGEVESNGDPWLALGEANKQHTEISSDCKESFRARIYPKGQEL